MSLERIICFCPDNIQLYKQALRHRSSSVETDDGKWINNERLEFLGDAILDAVVADLLYKNFPNKREGFLTNLRSKIVQREMMDKIAQQLGLDEMVIYSSRMTINSHHGNHMYGNALEALIGAIYLDGGLESARTFILSFLPAKARSRIPNSTASSFHTARAAFLRRKCTYIIPTGDISAWRSTEKSPAR